MNVSKILEAIIAQVTFDTMKSGKNSMLKDQLMLALLRIENCLDIGAKSQVEIPEIFFESYLQQLQNSQKTDSLSTLNAVIDILSDSTTASPEIFKMYGVNVV